MIEYRLAKESDQQSLFRFLGNFQIGSRESTAWRFCFEHSKNGSPDACVPLEFTDGEITSAICIYSISAAWEKEHCVVPFYVIGIYRATHSTTPLAKRTDVIGSLGTQIMEQNGLTTFYMTRLVPTTLNFSNCAEYINRRSSKLFGISRYDCRVEELLSSNFNFFKLPRMYQLITYDTCPKDKKIAILRYDLNHRYKNENQYNSEI